MPIEVIIPIPIKEFNHYKELQKTKMWDTDFEIWTVLNAKSAPNRTVIPGQIAQ